MGIYHINFSIFHLQRYNRQHRRPGYIRTSSFCFIPSVL